MKWLLKRPMLLLVIYAVLMVLAAVLLVAAINDAGAWLKEFGEVNGVNFPEAG